uniref:DUF4158 domain-containing protein n=1 Tax=Nocardia farcinica TaxID=37329 RepID=UPI0024551A73
MATRMFADEELERLRGFPEISREELFRYFTLTSADLAFVDPGRGGRARAERRGGQGVCLAAVGERDSGLAGFRRTFLDASAARAVAVAAPRVRELTLYSRVSVAS